MVHDIQHKPRTLCILSQRRRVHHLQLPLTEQNDKLTLLLSTLLRKGHTKVFMYGLDQKPSRAAEKIYMQENDIKMLVCCIISDTVTC